MNTRAKKWVEFLKTNPEKTKEELQNFDDINKRCCLGHAIHIHYDEMLKAKIYSEDYTEHKRLVMKDDGVLLEEEKNYLKLLSITGHTLDLKPLKYKGKLIKNYDGDNINSLIELNDGTGYSHKEIGEIIEENQDILFYKSKQA